MTPYFARLAQRAGAEVRPDYSSRRESPGDSFWGELVAEVATASAGEVATTGRASPQRNAPQGDMVQAQTSVARTEVATAASMPPAMSATASDNVDIDVISTAIGVATPPASAETATVTAAPAARHPSQSAEAQRDAIARTATTGSRSLPTTAADGTAQPTPDRAISSASAAHAPSAARAPSAASAHADQHAIRPTTAQPVRAYRHSHASADAVANESHENAASTSAAAPARTYLATPHVTSAQPHPALESMRERPVPVVAQRPAATKATAIEVSIGRVDVEIIGTTPASRPAVPPSVIAPLPAANPRASFNARRHYLRGS